MQSFDARHSRVGSLEKPLLVLATTFAEPSSPSKFLIQENTLRNLASFQPDVHPVVFSDSALIASHCKKHGIEVIADVP